NVLADLGFAGNVSISVDRVKILKRFIGWANFVFDTQSSFFDKPVGDVFSLIVSGPRINPDQSNLSLAIRGDDRLALREGDGAAGAADR
ncbi:hypothetical protein ACC687_39060, partial [Rhizobium ruizarguesonis]